jgi:hypothetical protein
MLDRLRDRACGDALGRRAVGADMDLICVAETIDATAGRGGLQ